MVAAKLNKKLRSILTRYSLVDETVIEKALSEVDGENSLIEVLLSEESLDEGKFLSALAKESSLPPIDVTKLDIPDELKELLPENLATYYGVLPVARVGKVLTLAVADPYDIIKLDDIAMVTSCTIKPVLSTGYAIKNCIPELYDQGSRKMQDLIDGLDIWTHGCSLGRSELRKGHSVIPRL